MIKQTFQKAKEQNRALFAAFITCGDPDIQFTERLIETISKKGVDLIELGVPFSDPMADGPTIQASSLRALDSGTNILQIIEMAARIRKKNVETPMILFGYYNVFFKCGVEKIARLSSEAGINAWLIADLPLEEMDEVLPSLRKYNLDFIPLAAPTTPPERVREISEKASGFLYYVTVAGVTGVRDSMPDGLIGRLEEVKKASKLPIGAGFGISTPDGAHTAAMHADAVIVGSKIVDLIYKTRMEKGEDQAIIEAGAFAEKLSKAMQR